MPALVAKTRTNRAKLSGDRCWHAFPTELGWMAIAGSEDCLAALSIGHPTRAAAERSLTKQVASAGMADDWWPELTERIQNFAAGEPDNFTDIEVNSRGWTPFQQRVYAACRSIPLGRTLSYAELAKLVRSPNAARAVGNCMARNSVPLIIPCHRVVGSGGNLGGYSGAGGLTLKRRLLELEEHML